MFLIKIGCETRKSWQISFGNAVISKNKKGELVGRTAISKKIIYQNSRVKLVQILIAIPVTLRDQANFDDTPFFNSNWVLREKIGLGEQINPI